MSRIMSIMIFSQHWYLISLILILVFNAKVRKVIFLILKIFRLQRHSIQQGRMFLIAE